MADRAKSGSLLAAQLPGLLILALGTALIVYGIVTPSSAAVIGGILVVIVGASLVAYNVYRRNRKLWNPPVGGLPERAADTATRPRPER